MTARPNGPIFNRTHIDVGPLFGNGIYAYCGCYDCGKSRCEADWTGYVPSMPTPSQEPTVTKVDPYTQPEPTTNADLVTIDEIPVGAEYALVDSLGDVLLTRVRTEEGGMEPDGTHTRSVNHTTHASYRILKMPTPTACFADLAQGDFFSNANDPETLFVKRRSTRSGSAGFMDYTAVWVHNPDGSYYAGSPCCIEDDREVIPRQLSFQFD